MKFENIDINKLKLKMNDLKSWDDWIDIEDTIFDLENWEKKDIDLFSKEFEERKESIIENIEWFPLYDSYQVEGELKYLYETCRNQAFEKLEPNAHRENIKNSADYGKMCVVCDMYTKERIVKKCPLCARNLFDLLLENK